MARKQKHEEHVNHERWLVSYADFITLLFAFFVVMYAVSSLNTGKYRVLSDSLVAAFRVEPKTLDPIQFGGPSKSPQPPNQNTMKKPTVLLPFKPPFPRTPVEVKEEQAQDKQIRLYDESATDKKAPMDKELSAPQGKAPKDAAVPEPMQQIADEIERALAALVQRQQVSVQREQYRLEIEINENVLFGSGRARLEPQALPVIGKIADILKPFANTVHVEGFTDNVPIKTLAFPSNWELSAARAASVAHLLAEEGIEAARLAAIGYGEQRPIADNITAEGRQKNRRIVLVVLADEATLQRLEAERPGISRERTVAQEIQQAPPAPVAGEFTIASPPAPLEEAAHAVPAPFVPPAPDMPLLQDTISVPAAPVSPAPAAEPEPVVVPATTPAPSAQPATPRATAFSPIAAPIRLFSPIAVPPLMGAPPAFTPAVRAPGSMTSPVPPPPVSAAAMPPVQEITPAAPVSAPPVVSAPATPSLQEVMTAAPPVAVIHAPAAPVPAPAKVAPPPAAAKPVAPQPAGFAPIAPPIRLFAPLAIPPALTSATRAPGNAPAPGGKR
ncbi:MAG: flagellar motor protein MotD [Gammaproteobacteria bacterium]|nr:flagellar motor protein MotD [Gammaproteobacteria bacterium]